MKHKVLFTTFFLLATFFASEAWSHDFSAVSPNGQTLYYYFNADSISVVTGWPNRNATTVDELWIGYTKPTGALVIPSTVTYNGTTYTVTRVGNFSFYGCSDLTSVTIPSSVTSIGTAAFRECSSLTFVSIPASVTHIRNSAFYNCSSLSSINIPSSVTYIGDWAFRGTSSLTSITLPYSIDTIHTSTFAVSGLTSISIPSSVVSICDRAFGWCYNLSSVSIPNSVDSIGKNAFIYDTNLTSMTIPNSVIAIGIGAFNGCVNLTSLTIGNSVASIDVSAFFGCNNLTSVNYMGTVAQWCEIDFREESSNPTSYSHSLSFGGVELTNLVIPDNITEIKNYAFINCGDLTSVTIPNSLNSIGYSSFSGCIGLNEITSHATTAPFLTGSAFNDVPNNIIVNIPCGSLMSYYSRWNQFSNFIEDEGFSFSASSADETMGTVQILTQPTCQSPTAVVYAVANEGYRFDHWNDGNSNNPRTLTLSSDTSLICFFAQAVRDTIYIHDTVYVYIHDTIYISEQGIGDVNTTNVMVYQRDGQIVVEGDFDGQVALYDVNGRVLAVKRNDMGTIRFDVPSSGAYLIKVGNHPARKIVVVR